MIVIAFMRTACLFRAKINKKRWPSYFKIWPPYTSNVLAPALST